MALMKHSVASKNEVGLEMIGEQGRAERVIAQRSFFHQLLGEFQSHRIDQIVQIGVADVLKVRSSFDGVTTTKLSSA